MRKLAIFSMFLLGLAACSEEEAQQPLQQEQQFPVILKSKTWVITKYEFQDHLNAYFPLRNFYNDSVYTRISEVTPDPCNWSGTTTSPMGTWKSYEAKFTENSTLGTFSFDMREVNWDTAVTNQNNCTIGYITTDHTDHITKPWSYNDQTETFTTSFGEPYEILDGQESYFEMDYKVVSYDVNKIVLEGRKYYQGPNDINPVLFITNNITLE